MKSVKKLCLPKSQILVISLLIVGSLYIFREPLSKMLDNDARCK